MIDQDPGWWVVDETKCGHQLKQGQYPNIDALLIESKRVGETHFVLFNINPTYDLKFPKELNR